MEQIILEANRLRSIEQNQDKKLDDFNNRWTNSVSTTGIEVRAGDIISIESAAINAKGNEVQDTMEFRGITDAGFKDNELQLEYSYYVNHTGHYTIPLPFREDLTYNGVFQTNEDHANNYNSAYAQNLRTRQLGEWSPDNVPRPATGDTSIMDYRTNPQHYFFYPNPLDIQEKGGYTAGEICAVYYMDSTTAKTTGIFLQINTVRTEGTTSGLIDTWEVHSINPAVAFDDNLWRYSLGITNSQRFYISNLAAVQNPTANSTIGVIFKNPKTYAVRKDMLPDGKRFYRGNSKFIGFGLTNFGGVYDGITNVPTVAQDADDPIGITDRILGSVPVPPQPWERVTSTTTLTVPTGFSTPTDVGGILTDQLHSPEEVNQSNEVAEFVNLKNYSYFGVFEGIPTKPPPIITTPSFKPIPAGFNTFVQNPPIDTINNVEQYYQVATYAQQYQIFYNSVYWEDPARIEALSIFRQFYYGADNSDVKNEINSGRDQLPNVGDMNNQTIGLNGLIPRMLNNWDSIGTTVGDRGQNQLPATVSTVSSNAQRYYPIRTNIRYTKDVVERLAAAFKKIEVNRDTDNGLPTTAGGKLPNTSYNNSVTNKDNFAVKLDIGGYVDEVTQPGEPTDMALRIWTGTGNNTSGVAQPSYFQGTTEIADYYEFNQKYKWRATSELSGLTPGTDFTYVSTSVTKNTQGNSQVSVNPTMDADTFQLNNGQDLPQIWVQSRWRDGFRARQMTPDASNLFPSYSDAVEDLMDDNQTAPDMPYPNQYSVAELQDRFERPFTDPDTGISYSYEDYLQWAIDADIGIMPYFAEEGDATYGDVPYIAFLCFDRLWNDLTGYITNPFPARPYVIDTAQMPYGEFFGFDCSFSRNKAVFFQNTQNLEEMKASRYKLDASQGINGLENFYAADMGMIGASNPIVNFNGIKSRFELKGLSTPMTIGNPFLVTAFGSKTATDNPEQIVYTIGRDASNYFYYTRKGTGLTAEHKSPEVLNQADGTFIDAYSGISIEKIILIDPNTGNTQELKEYSDLNAYYFNNCLLNKMGFELPQLLPPVGDIQARFENSLFTDPLQDSVQNLTTRVVKPVTTNAYISSAEYQPTATDFNRFPLYGLGTAQDIQAEPSVESGALLAKNLPSKLDFPYLMVYTNLGLEMLYYGGEDAHSRLPCLAFISRNYSAGDFFYMPASSFTLTASRDFVLTDVTTDIRLPDGSKPRLSPHSSVIYKITRAPPQPQAAEEVEQKKNSKKLLTGM